MKTVTSLSGGMSSAMCEVVAPADYLVFALVRSENPKTLYPDAKVRQMVSDRIGKDFIGTMEDDIIINTMLDLEQYFGKYIKWVSGDTYESILKKRGGYLPNISTRYCTTYLKIDPIVKWWADKFNRQPVKMSIGYRSTEANRVSSMKKKLNQKGVSEYKTSFEKHKDGPYKGKNKWETVAWRVPTFPLFERNIDKTDVRNYWKDKPVRFAQHNNCVGCFHRSPSLLKYMSENHSNKYAAFIDLEGIGKGTFKKNISYEKITKLNFTGDLFGKDDEQEGCNSGFCGF